MENLKVETLKEIACAAFMQPDFRLDYVSRVTYDNGFVRSQPVKPRYSIKVEQKENGDLQLTGREFGDISLTITKKEQLQYIASISQIIDNNTALITDALKKYEGRKLNAFLYNALTGKHEYVDNISESSNTLADAVEMANSATISISEIDKIGKDEYVARNIKMMDDFFCAFEAAEQGISSSNKKGFHDIIRSAYDEYSEYGELNYRFKIDNKLPVNNFSNKFKKVRNQKTDDVLLNECLDAMGRSLKNEEFFLLVNKYLSGKTDEVKQEAELLKSKLNAASAAEKFENRLSQRQIAEQSLRYLYIGAALDYFYKRIDCCSSPELYDFEQKETLKKIPTARPVNPLKKMEDISAECSKCIKDVNERAAAYVVAAHQSDGNVDALNYRTAQGRVAQSNERALMTWARASKLFTDFFK